MKKIIFVKPIYLFQSGDTAVVPDRIANHLTGTGFAYAARLPADAPEEKPTAPAPAKKSAKPKTFGAKV